MLIINIFLTRYSALDSQYSAMCSKSSEDYFIEAYSVDEFNSSFHSEKWGSYDATIYYPFTSLRSNTTQNISKTPYPIIVFAHGFMCTKNEYSWIGKILASHGYISILFTTPSKLNPYDAFSQSLDGISVAIDHVIELNILKDGPLYGLVDEEKIGIMGHSMGGITSLKAAAKDQRIKTVVALAPGHFSNFTETYLSACKKITAPTQIIMGSFDFICSPEGGRQFYDLINSEKEMLIINGADHGMGIWKADDVPIWLKIIPLYDPVKQENYRNTTMKYFLSWFNYHLNKELDYQHFIYSNEAWNDLEKGVLTELENTRDYQIYVKDENLEPIAGVEISLLDHNSTVLDQTTTDTNGTAIFNHIINQKNYKERVYIKAEKDSFSSEKQIDLLNNSKLHISYEHDKRELSDTPEPVNSTEATNSKIDIDEVFEPGDKSDSMLLGLLFGTATFLFLIYIYFTSGR